MDIEPKHFLCILPIAVSEDEATEYNEVNQFLASLLKRSRPAGHDTEIGKGIFNLNLFSFIALPIP